MTLGFYVISPFHFWYYLCFSFSLLDEIHQGYVNFICLFKKQLNGSADFLSSIFVFCCIHFCFLSFPVSWNTCQNSLFGFFFCIYVLRLDISLQVLILPSPTSFNMYLLPLWFSSKYFPISVVFFDQWVINNITYIWHNCIIVWNYILILIFLF